MWALIPVTFIDCGFRVIGGGSITRSIAEKHEIAKERLAFMLNNTASPIVELIPIATTFVGFNIAIIGQGLKAARVEGNYSAYLVLLHAIPFEFFSIVVVAITFLSIFVQLKKPGKSQNEPHLQKESSDLHMSMDMEDTKPEITPRVINLIIPILSIIFLSFFFFWFFDVKKSNDISIMSAITNTEPNRAMLTALFISLIISVIFYFFQKYKINKMTRNIISGGNEIMNTLFILILAWSLAA